MCVNFTAATHSPKLVCEMTQMTKYKIHEKSQGIMTTPKSTNFTIMNSNENELDKEFKRMIMKIFDKVTRIKLSF